MPEGSSSTSSARAARLANSDAPTNTDAQSSVLQFIFVPPGFVPKRLALAAASFSPSNEA